ncbi:PREDICTED: charged multivesicular body protein 2b-like, partial [Rhagoletis zephyria]|uniref:charged multivesicular body protein 2b-like n=1 Tax=Rhagoletis zephyria TaxID=28612 RepID=UPI000811A67B
EAARKQQREITRAQRTVQRSTVDLEKEEKKLETEIKKLAKQGQTKACQTLAKQLIQIRNQKTRATAANYRIGAVGAQAKMMGANNVVAAAMGSASNAMKVTNEQMNPEKISGILKQFEEENMKMDMKDEMIEESLNGILDNSDDESEQDLVVNKILDEIGIEVNQKLSKVSAPKGDLSMNDIEALISGPSTSSRQALKQ